MKKQLLSFALMFLAFAGLNAQILTDDFEAYDEGAIGPQSANWTTWSGTEGGAEDGIVSSDYALSGIQSMVIEEGGAQDVLLLLGDSSTGRYSLSWNVYFEDISSTGYYNFQGSAAVGTVFVQQFFFNSGGTAEGIYSNDLSDSLATFNAEEWININHIVDLDNDVMHVLFNGTAVAIDIPITDNLSSIDFFSIDDANRMYIDDVNLTALPSVEACDATDLLYCENFDEYISGSTMGQWSDQWTTWSGVEGTSEDGLVSDEQAASGSNSMLVAEGGVQDVIVLLGDYDTGGYEVKFNMYVPAGATGYYNFQGSTAIGTDFVQQIFLNNGGAAAGTLEVENVGTVAYPEDEWFEVSHIIDLDGDAMTVSVNGVAAPAGPYAGTTGNLSAIDFFSIDASNRYYIDDFTIGTAFIDVIGEPCTLGAQDLACDNIESYPAFSGISGNAAWWTTWDGNEGGPQECFVSPDQAESGIKSVLVAEGGIEDILLLLGDQTTGSYNVSFDYYVPSGATAYYNIQESETPAVAWNMDVFFNEGGLAPGTGVITTFDNAPFTYPEDEWFTVSQSVDLDGDLINVFIDGVQVITDQEYTGNLGSINFYSIDATNRYYIDNVLYTDLATGINQFSVSDLEIFPNPNNGTFTIVNDSKAGLYTVRVTDLAGRVIMNDAMALSEGQSRAIVLENATTGMYLVQLIDEDNATLRVVKMMVE